MPKIRIDDTDGFLSSALRAYQGELIEVSSAVQTQARVAALVRHRRALKLGLAYPRPVDLEAVLQDGEGQEIEFMAQFPRNAHDLAKEIAAFATSNAGTIFLGVADDGEIVGLEEVASVRTRDRLRTRIEGLSSNAVSPSISVRIAFETYRPRRVARIEVPKGPEPVYFSSDTPY